MCSREGAARRAAPAGEAKRGPRGGLRSGYGSGGTLLSSPFTRFPSGGDVVTSFWSLASQFRVNSPRQQASGLKAALPPGSGGLCLQHPHWPERVHGRVPVAPRGHRDRPACQLRGLVLGIQAPRAGRAPEGAAGLPHTGSWVVAARLGCTRLSRSVPTQGPLAGVGAPSGLPSRDQDPSIVPTHATAPDQGPHDHTSLFLPLVQPQGSGGGGCSAPQSHRGCPPPGAPSAWSWGGTPQTPVH